MEILAFSFFFHLTRPPRLAMCHTQVSVSGSLAMLNGFLKDARFGPHSNLHTCISRVEVYRIGQCVGWKFTPMPFFIDLARPCAFGDVPHLRFRCRDPKLCLMAF